MVRSVVPWEEYSGGEAEDLISAWLVRTVPGAPPWVEAAQAHLIKADKDARPAGHRGACRPVSAHARIRDVFEPDVGRVADYEVSGLSFALVEEVVALPDPGMSQFTNLGSLPAIGEQPAGYEFPAELHITVQQAERECRQVIFRPMPTASSIPRRYWAPVSPAPAARVHRIRVPLGPADPDPWQAGILRRRTQSCPILGAGWERRGSVRRRQMRAS